MNRLFLTILFLILPSLQGCLQVEDESDTTIRLATTTSLRDSGLLNELLTDFTERSAIEVDVIAVGSGAAMSLAENGDVDVLIVHDPIREVEFIENGFAENMYLIYRGKVRLETEHTSLGVDKIREGEYFGVLELLSKSPKRLSSAIAQETTILYEIPYSHTLQECMPWLQRHFEQTRVLRERHLLEQGHFERTFSMCCSNASKRSAFPPHVSLEETLLKPSVSATTVGVIS